MAHRVLYMGAAPQAHREVTLSVEPPEFEHDFIEQDDAPDTVRAKLAAAEFIVTGAVTAEQIAAAPKLRMIQMPGVGYEKIDVEAAEARGIPVAITPEGTIVGVSEHVVLMMLAIYKHLVEAHNALKAGRWIHNYLRQVALMLYGKRVGIVGLGRIGKGVAQRVSGFETHILAYEPYTVDQEFCARYGVQCVPLEQVLRESDFVTLHLPASAETRHFMNAERLALMKPTAYIVNTARGSLIDEDALYAALTGGRLAGAGLDVRESEPPKDNRFNDLPNVILTSHIAGVTHETVAAMAHMAVDSILEATSGTSPRGLLNPDAWERRRR